VLFAGAMLCANAQWLNYPTPGTPRTREWKDGGYLLARPGMKSDPCQTGTEAIQGMKSVPPAHRSLSLWRLWTIDGIPEHRPAKENEKKGLDRTHLDVNSTLTIIGKTEILY
jgi:hypothetical protein